MEDIDLIITWVNPEDREWRDSLLKTSDKNKIEYSPGSNRYYDWGFIRYVIGGAVKYMPWLKNIYLVVSGSTQINKNIDTSKVKIITHNDIIPHDLLPTFNSAGIEMWLYRIPGLSEKFLYANDDTVPVRYSSPDDWFDETGRPRIFFKTVKASNAMYRMQEKNNLSLACQDLNMTWAEPDKILLPPHGITAHLKSDWEFFQKKYKNIIYNSCTPFRNIKNYNQDLTGIWRWLQKNCGEYKIKHMYGSLGTEPPSSIIKKINTEGAQTICLNDTAWKNWLYDKRKYNKVILRALDKKIF